MLFDSDQLFAVGLASIERLLELGGRDVAEVAVEALRVVPVHPAQGRELEIIDRFPRPRFRGPAHKLSLVIAVHRLSEGIVIALTG